MARMLICQVSDMSSTLIYFEKYLIDARILLTTFKKIMCNNFFLFYLNFVRYFFWKCILFITVMHFFFLFKNYQTIFNYTKNAYPTFIPFDNQTGQILWDNYPTGHSKLLLKLNPNYDGSTTYPNTHLCSQQQLYKIWLYNYNQLIQSMFLSTMPNSTRLGFYWNNIDTNYYSSFNWFIQSPLSVYALQTKFNTHRGLIRSVIMYLFCKIENNWFSSKRFFFWRLHYKMYYKYFGEKTRNFEIKRHLYTKYLLFELYDGVEHEGFEFFNRHDFVFLLRQFKDLKFKDDLEPLTLIKQFFFNFFNDFFILDNYQTFYQMRPLLEKVSGIPFLETNENQIAYVQYVKMIFLNYMLTDFVKQITLFKTADLHVAETKDLFQKFNHIRLFFKRELEKTALLRQSNTLVKITKPSDTFKTKAIFWLQNRSPKPIRGFRRWHLSIMWANKENYAMWNFFYYSKSLLLFWSLRQKLISANFDVKYNSNLNWFFNLYSSAYRKWKMPEYPSAPWVQTSKHDVMKFLIEYFTTSLPNTWYEQNTSYLLHLSNQTNVSLSETDLVSCKRLFFREYLYSAVFEKFITNLALVNVLRKFLEWKSFPYHYGQNDFIRHFLIMYITDAFLLKNAGELIEFQFYSSITKSYSQRKQYLKNIDMVYDKHASGISTYYPGYELRLCRSVFANFLYEDILRFISNDSRDLFSTESRLSFSGNSRFYPDYQIKEHLTWYNIDFDDPLNLGLWPNRYIKLLPK